MRYLGFLSYRGTGSYGFDRQKEKRSIQGVVEEVLSQVCGENIKIHGAGRTDSGVHALSQGFSFDTSSSLPKEKIVYAANRLLPDDILLKSLEKKDPPFDGRHSVSGKVYEYRFSYGQKDPFEVGLLTQLQRPDFDVAAFRECLSCFVGTHDFSNLTNKKDDKDNFIRTIDSIKTTVDEKAKKGVVLFSGVHFMTYQVRFMMGLAFQCAYHQKNPEDIPALMNEKPRRILSYKAPADGLYLKEVTYESGEDD